MLLLLIDAGVLMLLLKSINDDDIGFGAAIVTALVTAIATTALAMGLITVIGPWGILVAALLAAALLGVAVSAMFGVEIKRSILIGVIFVVVHIAASFGLQAMMG
jgi:hypothetical protein